MAFVNQQMVKNVREGLQFSSGHLVLQLGFQRRTKGVNVWQVRQDWQLEDHCQEVKFRKEQGD